ncbi:Dyp-type peroxidase [Actinospica durhamensis]|uniref:Dyp-type peroxidase n=1 Tax=Actinospica durhamensis TaxID=1508375 RepID=A0A941EXI0_9ACTN|nr:Dyp-type peroxidase [Actinospica durhamensis]MBR7839041.1 Dyp-type peroxidase [Actinospica durhamensis]
MSEPQPVVGELTSAAVIVVATIEPGGEDAVREALADFGDLEDSVGFGSPLAELSCVTAFGSDAWDRLFGGPKPPELHPFVPLDGPRHAAPATPGDLLLHVRSENQGLCFELAHRLLDRLGPAVTVVDETHGFRYYDRRDLLGFVDGTANPHGRGALDAALIGPEDPFAGGSYVIVQKYLHDLAAWNAVSVSEQEHVIGRSKLENIEMSDEAKPGDSHVAVNTVIGEDGEEVDIMRFNMPFGELKSGEFGTYFMAYAASAATTEQMLRAMFLGTADAPRGDRILDFSTALTGGLFFAPPVEFLDDPPQPGVSAAELLPITADAVPVASPSDGSLRIGSLKASMS